MKRGKLVGIALIVMVIVAIVMCVLFVKSLQLMVNGQSEMQASKGDFPIWARVWEEPKLLENGVYSVRVEYSDKNKNYFINAVATDKSIKRGLFVQIRRHILETADSTDSIWVVVSPETKGGQ